MAVAALASAGCTGNRIEPPASAAAPWSRVAVPGFAPGAPVVSLSGLAASEGGATAWLAAGTVTEPSGARTATVWSSPNGRQWLRAGLESTGMAGATAAAVVWHKGMAVAVGATLTAEGDRDAAAWTSPDGISWSPRRPLAAGPGRQEATAVATGPLGLLASGYDLVDGRRVSALWRSPDGALWERVGGRALTEGHHVAAVAVGAAGMACF